LQSRRRARRPELPLRRRSVGQGAGRREILISPYCLLNSKPRPRAGVFLSEKISLEKSGKQHRVMRARRTRLFLGPIKEPNLASTERRTPMSKFLTSMAVMLTSILLASSEASTAPISSTLAHAACWFWTPVPGGGEVCALCEWEGLHRKCYHFACDPGGCIVVTWTDRPGRTRTPRVR